MKKTVCWIGVALLGAMVSRGQDDARIGAGGSRALISWHDPNRIQAGIGYARISRGAEADGVDYRLQADVAQAGLGLWAWPWLLIHGSAGACEARLEGAMDEKGSAEFAGRIGARANLWQIDEGTRESSWRFTAGIAGDYGHFGSGDDGDGKTRWNELRVALPLEYYLSFARTYRHLYLSEVHGMAIFAGPEASWIDGEWEKGGRKRNFEEKETFGAFAGAELWLLANLCFGVRLDWFEESTVELNVVYRF